MLRDVLESIISGVVILVVGYLLWWPGEVYRDAITEVVGGFTTILLILGFCVGFGFVVRRITPIAPVNFAIGGSSAYLVGMYIIEADLEPGSPVHRYWFGLMLACVLFGHANREIFDWFLDRFVDSLDLSTHR